MDFIDLIELVLFVLVWLINAKTTKIKFIKHTNKYVGYEHQQQNNVRESPSVEVTRLKQGSTQGVVKGTDGIAYLTKK